MTYGDNQAETEEVSCGVYFTGGVRQVKAELEPSWMQYRGVSLISETEEEKQVLERIWTDKGRSVMLGRRRDGNVQLVVAPTPGESDDKQGGSSNG